MKTIVVIGSKGQAVFSADRRYRYALTREFAPNSIAPSVCQFIMLNPSTADADVDDPTASRCAAFARSWGHTGMVITSLYALRVSDPTELYRAIDPVGEGNVNVVMHEATRPDISRVVCAWGARGSFADAGSSMLSGLRKRGITPYALRQTKNGQPAHPLYLPGDIRPQLLLGPHATDAR